MNIVNKSYESRFGFHPCDYDTFIKLKKLKKYYFQALYRHAEWQRWDRKAPQNQVIRRYKKNDKGQRIGYEIVGEKLQPKLYPVFGELRFVGKGNHALNDMGVLSAFDSARRPCSSSELVTPLNITIEQIDNMLSHLEKFEN